MSGERMIIGGREFAFRPLNAVEAIKLFVEIVSVVGEPAFKAFVEADKKSADANALGGMIIGLLSKNLNADQIADQMSRVFAVTTCDGVPVLLNTTFADRKTLEAFQVFLGALRYQYADFLAVGPWASILSQLPTGRSTSGQST